MPKVRHIPKRFLAHKVTVERKRAGTGGVTTWVAAGDPVACLVSAKRRLVRDADGTQVVSEATLITRLENEALFDTGRRVTLPSGKTTTVLAVNPHDDGGIAGAWCHLEVVCE